MSFGNWLFDLNDLHVGQKLTVKGANSPNPRETLRGGVVQIVKIDKDYVWLLQVADTENKPYYDPTKDIAHAVKVPKASLYHFIDDLSGEVISKKKSGNEYVDAVLAGKAQFLGKGDEGVAYRYGDKVIKVATTVPYQAMFYNNPHRTPQEAIAKLKNEYEMSEKLRRLEVPCILPGQFLVHDGRAYLIRPFIEITDKFNLDQLKELKAAVEGIHAAGYIIRDNFQLGLWQGHVFFYDLGHMITSDSKMQMKDEMDNVQDIYIRNGYRMRPLTFKFKGDEDKLKPGW